MPAQVRVFVGWSGPRSKAAAIAMRDWLPQVIQAAEPWLSEAMDRGAQWFATIGAELKKADYGLLCVTPENADEPWVLFEAGALALRTSERLACPYLLDMAPAALAGPLAQLQAATADREGTRQVVETINNLLDQAVRLSESRLANAFEKWWPELERKLAEARAAAPAPPRLPERSEADKLDEILETVRAIQRSQTRGVDAADSGSVESVGGTTIFRPGLGLGKTWMVFPTVVPEDAKGLLNEVWRIAANPSPAKIPEAKDAKPPEEQKRKLKRRPKKPPPA